MIRLAKPKTPPFSQISKQYQAVLKSGMLTNAKYVRQFEKKCGIFLKNKKCVAVANGTSALNLAIIALNLKGEVILPSFTYSSTGHTLLWNNIKPVFADINPNTFNIDPDDIEKRITKKTSAILAVHCFGNPVNINAVQMIAKKHKLKVIYDAAHAFGSLYHNKSIAQFGDALIFSFTPTKILTTAEGGLIVIKDKKLINKIKNGLLNGDSLNRQEEFLGVTARLTEFNAILGLANLKTLPQDIKNRLKTINSYHKNLKSISDISFQKVDSNDLSVYKDMTIIINSGSKTRNKLLKTLHQNDIQAKVYFDPPLHKKKVYAQYPHSHLKNTNWVSSRIISLPLYSDMKPKEVNQVCQVIKQFFTKK